MAWSYPASFYTGSFQASSTACLGADGYGPVTKNTASAFGLNFRYRGISSRFTTLSDAQHDWVAGMCAAAAANNGYQGGGGKGNYWDQQGKGPQNMPNTEEELCTRVADVQDGQAHGRADN